MQVRVPGLGDDRPDLLGVDRSVEINFYVEYWNEEPRRCACWNDRAVSLTNEDHGRDATGLRAEAPRV